MSTGILRHDIMANFNITVLEFGDLVGWYYLGYAGMQVPIGSLLDKYNPKYISFFSLLICSIGTLAFVATDSWVLGLFGRFLIGFGSATAVLFCIKVVTSYYPSKYHAIMIGLSVTGGLLGAIWGGNTMKEIFQMYGYHTTFYGLVAVGCTLGFLTIITPTPQTLDVTDNQAPSTTFSETCKLIFNPILLFIGICGGLIVGTLEGFADVWAISFFESVFQFNTHDSTALATTVFEGLAIGGIIIPPIALWFRNDSIFVFVLGIINAAVYFFLFKYTNMSYLAVYWLMMLLGLLCAYQTVIFNIVTKFVGAKYSGVAIALTNCINMAFGSIFHKLIVQRLYDYNTAVLPTGDEITQVGQVVDQYTPEAYIHSLMPIPMLSILGAFGFIYIAYYLRKNPNISVSPKVI